MSRYLRPAEVPGLEEVLHADADLALDAADRLLEHLREERVRAIDPNVVPELAVGVEHGLPP
jgi:hypothetical protein